MTSNQRPDPAVANRPAEQAALHDATPTAAANEQQGPIESTTADSAGVGLDVTEPPRLDPYARLRGTAWTGQLPVYPPPLLSRDRVIVVVLEIFLLADGSLRDVGIIESSGFPTLDDAALEQASTRRYARSDGARRVEQMVTFQSSRD